MATLIAGSRLEQVLYSKGSNITDDPYLEKTIRPFFGPRQQTQEKTISTSEMLQQGLSIAKKADVVVAVLGENENMSGEAASRSDINIPESQKNLLKALVGTGKPVILVLINGRPK